MSITCMEVCDMKASIFVQVVCVIYPPFYHAIDCDYYNAFFMRAETYLDKSSMSYSRTRMRVFSSLKRPIYIYENYI